MFRRHRKGTRRIKRQGKNILRSYASDAQKNVELQRLVAAKEFVDATFFSPSSRPSRAATSLIVNSHNADNIATQTFSTAARFVE